MSRTQATFVTSLVAGFLGAALYHSGPAQAASQDGLWVTGPDGKDRIQIATYTAAHERGLPLVALFDNRSRLRMLLRLAGSNESPVLIFKDRRGSDRIVLGLGLSGEEEPFLSTTDRSGKKTNHFGSY